MGDQSKSPKTVTIQSQNVSNVVLNISYQQLNKIIYQCQALAYNW